MYLATCTHTTQNPCKHYEKQHKNCKKRPQTKSCHYTNKNTCKTCTWKEECDLIIPMHEYPSHTRVEAGEDGVAPGIGIP